MCLATHINEMDYCGGLYIIEHVAQHYTVKWRLGSNLMNLDEFT